MPGECAQRQACLSQLPAREPALLNLTFSVPLTLRAFDEPELRVHDYEEAPRIKNICRARGIAGLAIDFLICATSQLRNWEVFTTDCDFIRYSKVLPLRLYPGSESR